MLRVTKDGDGLRLRVNPSLSSKTKAQLASGTPVRPVSEYAWREVEVSGVRGWVAERYLEEAPDPPAPTPAPAPKPSGRFDPNTPTYLQKNDYTCAVASAIWCLRSIGINVTPEEAHDAFVPQYVNSSVGLRDASGRGVVEALKRHWNVEAQNFAPLAWEQVTSWAGKMPVMIGGRAWYHWSAVRGFDGERLIMANPAGTGPRYGQQTLTRQQFNDLGWFSAVRIPV